jgi:hypothetical protein
VNTAMKDNDVTERPLCIQVAEALGCTLGSMSDIDGPVYYCKCPGGVHEARIGINKLPGKHWIKRYDLDWSATGPLIEKYEWDLRATPWRDGTKEWEATAWLPSRPEPKDIVHADGPTPLIAVCELIVKLHKAGKL